MVKRVTEKAEWDAFLANQHNVSFLQSWEWGSVQKLEGREVGRFIAGDSGAQVVRYPLPFGRSYLYVPRGPLGDGQQTESLYHLFASITVWARPRDIFLRIDPSLHADVSFLRSLGFKEAPAIAGRSAVAQPSTVAVVDLLGSESDVLGRMKAKSRYNVRLARRHGVTTRIVGAREACANGTLDQFYRLLQKTADRASFYPHPQKHYRHLAEIFDKHLWFIEALHGGDRLASLMILCWGESATYLHGGSLREKSGFMASYAAHWAAMRWAREQGCRWYDLGAVSQKKDDDYYWKGLTRFKMGLGASEQTHPHSIDRVYAPPWYRMYHWARSLRCLL